MAQDVHIIDLRRSYLPLDPNAFPATMHATQAEDAPERSPPVTPYDGYNFMPTPQGYCSFFGINTDLDFDPLVARCDDLFMIQTPQYQNILIALAEDGIWVKDGSTPGAWNHLVVLTVPAVGVHKQWSKCVIDNVLYVYRQEEPHIWEASPDNGYGFIPFVPTFLNMAGQLGIFKAGGRLATWDSENSIGWSAFGDTHDFTPSPETLAGNSIFQDIVGRIVVVLQHGTGFIIYCTKSIVKVDRNVESAMLWSGRAVFNNNGIAYREEACFAEPDTTHFAFSSQGLVEIGGDGRAQFVAPEISTYLKEKRVPMYLKVLNGRYLFIPLLHEDYLTGRVKFTTETVAGAIYSWKRASLAVENVESQCRAILAAMRNHDQIYLNNNFGYTSYGQATIPGQVPIWEDHLALTIPIAEIEAWKAHSPLANFGTVDYFLDNPFTGGGIPRIGGLGTEFMLPPPSVQLVATYVPIDHVEDNDKMFYHKQDMLWWAEERFFDHWKEAIYRQQHPPVIFALVEFQDTASETVLANDLYSFGPYLMPTFFSEANRVYGLASKSAWLQRSLTRGISVEFTSRTVKQVVAEMPWHGFGHDYPSYAAAAASWVADRVADANVLDPGNAPFTGVLTELATSPTTPRALRVTLTTAFNTPGGTSDAVPYKPGFGDLGGAGSGSIFRVGHPVYQTQRIQTFSVPEFKYVDYDTCVHKEIGYTKIKGHGHYTLLGNFVVDDAIAEAADYADVCLDNPTKKKQNFFNAVPIEDPWNNGATCGNAYPIVINGQPYVYPAVEDVVIPVDDILLQAGSIEPIYPTFLGAFVLDIHYKKWGKMKQNFKQLLDYLPVNNVGGDQVIPYDTFNPRVSALLESGKITIFDQFPSDSEIVFGKIGYYRKGFTDLEEVLLKMRALYNGWLAVEASLDGRNIEASLGVVRAFNAKNAIQEGFSLSARWYNVIVRGNYDLTYLETRGYRTGRR